MNEDRPVVRIEQVDKVYRVGEVDVPALRGIDLDIFSGEFLTIMGASGSGKSTLMNILGCLDRPTSGHYHLMDRDVAGLNRRELAAVRCRTLGFIFQSFNLLPRTTAQENVELPLYYAGVPAARRRTLAREALERVGLADRIRHRPNQLSGGQQQRVAIARALVNSPRLILADEPTGNLDSRTSIEIMGLFQSLGETGITLVLVTHEPDIARYASRVVRMKDGRIQKEWRQQPLLAGHEPVSEAGDTES
ncbi:MAG: ABC transporter ATP-binding protein [Myxococcales bacterium]|nr:ABC transporter ATP-binding protein [Myxococcales bacterium]